MAGVPAACLTFLSTTGGLDGFINIKELLLHVVAFGALLRFAKSGIVIVDRTLAALVLSALGLGLMSGLHAPNTFYAARAWFQLVSLVVVIYAASKVVRGGQETTLLVGCVLGAAAASLWALLEGQGIIERTSMPGRGPAGPAGNRNFLAHLLVVSLPSALLLAARGRLKVQRAFASVALALVGAALLVSRCRAAWIGATVMMTLLALLNLWKPSCFGDSRRRFVIAVLALISGAGVASYAGMGPAWKEAHPYQATLTRLGEWHTGTGRGRIIQYRNSLRMIAAHPLLGVGPGNWSIAYPRYASEGDPSYTPYALQPVNRLPNSDILGFLSEYGCLATGALILALAILLKRAYWAAYASARWDGLALGAALFGGTLAMSALDAVLLRPEPAMVFLVSIAVLLAAPNSEKAASISSPRFATSLLYAAIAIVAVATTYSGSRALSILVARSGDAEALRLSFALDPGNYLLARQLAWSPDLSDDERRALSTRAHRLFPGVNPGSPALWNAKHR